MLVVAALNGWGASSRPFKNRLTSIVQEAVEPHEHVFLGKRAMLTGHRSRRFRRFIQRHESPENVLLAVGKSLGARNMVKEVLNPLVGKVDGYAKILVLTIDPCWPTLRDWAPNLNRRILKLRLGVTKGINVYVIGKPNQQCGALLSGGFGIENRGLTKYTHRSVTTSPEAHQALAELITEAL